ncbi:reductase [Aspergillus sclerotialis]|uniref:3-hydroxy-3-methylglutaryl coenzyme A reductase n=1 Tax=Aspergillus sclerotialis TaxID=2070753 RepID=A0A3A3A5P4_9EURO|nr:reductase [Aspergillus sclerotialis]
MSDTNTTTILLPSKNEGAVDITDSINTSGKNIPSPKAYMTCSESDENTEGLDSSTLHNTHHQDDLRQSDRLQVTDHHEYPEQRTPGTDINELVSQCLSGNLSTKQLETLAESYEQTIAARREVVRRQVSVAKGKEKNGDAFFDALPLEGYHYAKAIGACCENIIGYMTVPVGIAGPLLVDNIEEHVPFATTEGALIAGVCRRCKAINLAGGAVTELIADYISRSPCLKCPSLATAYAAKSWLESSEGFSRMQKSFREAGRYINLKDIQVSIVGELLYPRFVASTGDAMGMNMISIAVEKAIAAFQSSGFSDIVTISLSGNMCSDKKPAAVNWIRGRGKYVVAQARLPSTVVHNTLKTTPATLVELNVAKNLTGSALAGSIGGFNAHASNIVSGIFLATGQDMAQVVESSNCLTTMSENGSDLLISVTMPSVEVATVGGGTGLPAQASMLKLLQLHGTHKLGPGYNAGRLARVIAATVLAGELNICSALATKDLTRAHLRLNRKGGSTGPNRNTKPI